MILWQCNGGNQDSVEECLLNLQTHYFLIFVLLILLLTPIWCIFHLKKFDLDCFYLPFCSLQSRFPLSSELFMKQILMFLSYNFILWVNFSFLTIDWTFLLNVWKHFPSWPNIYWSQGHISTQFHHSNSILAERKVTTAPRTPLLLSNLPCGARAWT